MLVDSFTPDNLIAGNRHVIAGGTVTVANGAGKLARGTVLARNTANKFEAVNAELTGKAEVILASDVDATNADAVAEVYITGDFNSNAVTVATGYTLSEADKLNLKNAGIYLIAEME